MLTNAQNREAKEQEKESKKAQRKSKAGRFRK